MSGDQPASDPAQKRAFGVEQPQPRKLYGDPTLDELVAAALERNADIRLAVARIEEADANLRAAVQTGFREVADALATVRLTSSSEEDYQVSVAAARRALRLSRMRYEAGYSPFLEVLDAQRTANTSELAALRNRQSLLSATVDLMKALGGGWSAEQVSLK